jgi:hypothetical protein
MAVLRNVSHNITAPWIFPAATGIRFKAMRKSDERARCLTSIGSGFSDSAFQASRE